MDGTVCVRSHGDDGTGQVAGERLFAEHRAALQAFFQRRIRTKSDAPDLAQEAYLRMLRVSDADAIRNPELYLYTVANNIVEEHAVLDRRQASGVDVDETTVQQQLAELPAFDAAVSVDSLLEQARAHDEERVVSLDEMAVIPRAARAWPGATPLAAGHRCCGVSRPHRNEPLPYAADSLWSFEIGLKSSLLDQRLDLDASVFHIRWDSPKPSPGYDCNPNSYRPVSAAVSNGLHLAARAYLSDHVRTGLALAYTDAHYGDEVDVT